MRGFSDIFHLVPLALLSLVATARADEFAPQFLAGRTVEYVPGTLPLIIAAPHGGRLDPPEIPDRVTGTLTRDAETDLLAMELASALRQRLGAGPHLVVCHLKRTKVDCNRDAFTGTAGNAQALATWRAFHEAIARARAGSERGLYLDLHGHSHPGGLVELGYLLTAEQLKSRGPDFAALAPASSLAALAEWSPTPFEELVRGPVSLGGLLEAAGFPSVPGPSHPHPGDGPYFRGGYNTARYGAGREGDGWFALQVECPRPGVRDNQANRRRFAGALAAALEQFLDRHAGLRLRATPAPAASDRESE